jgi:hypothetical protein
MPGKVKIILSGLCCFLFLLTASTPMAQYDPKLTEVWDPVPVVVTPGTNDSAPSDAIVLFDGKNTDEWTNEKGDPVRWEVKDGILTIKAGSGSIMTKREFADCQLHIEWRTPAIIPDDRLNQGNSGIFLQSRYELQIFDSYENPLYSNGQAASVYKQHAPLVNASLKPGQWQTYDIIYTAPRFNIDSTLRTPAYMTVLHNGLIVQNHVAIRGATTYTGLPKYRKHNFKQPLMLQDHRSPVSFRNIWIRDINTTRLFNNINTDGWYTYLDSLGRNNDPEKIFSVQDNFLHIDGKRFGYIATEKSYSDYYLKVVFKWGVKKYPPREKEKRDSGILYHFGVEEKDSIWPKSIECQIMEDECGDYYCIDTMIDSPNKSEFLAQWNLKHIFRTANFEKPTGEWNTIEVICIGNQSEHYVNGHLVNWGMSASVSHGKIVLQSEGAEICYKTVEMVPF